jgi:hypothetical protein
VKFEDAAEFRNAIECRLAELAIGDEEWLERDRLRIAFGRWLTRLSETAPKAWVLAGAFAIDCLSLRPRTARGLEVEWRIEHAGEFVDSVEKAAAHDAGDLFKFEIKVGGKGSGGKGAWNRYWVHALLDGKLFEVFEFTQNLRFGHIGSQLLRVDDLLGFADVQPPEVDVLLSEGLLAERLYSYFSCLSKGSARSPAEPLLDLKLIAELLGLDAVRVGSAAFRLFHMHGEEIPMALPDPPTEWAEQYQQLAESMGASADLDDDYAGVAALLDPSSMAAYYAVPGAPASTAG